jgi:hypothetical protein
MPGAAATTPEVETVTWSYPGQTTLAGQASTTLTFVDGKLKERKEN